MLLHRREERKKQMVSTRIGSTFQPFRCSGIFDCWQKEVASPPFSDSIELQTIIAIAIKKKEITALVISFLHFFVK